MVMLSFIEYYLNIRSICLHYQLFLQKGLEILYFSSGQALPIKKNKKNKIEKTCKKKKASPFSLRNSSASQKNFDCFFYFKERQVHSLYLCIITKYMCQYLQIMLNIFSLINPVYNDAPEPWQIGFQDGASPTFEGITELHNSIFFYLLLISVGVAWMIGSVVVNYSSNASPIVYKYANHGF